jgi:hypothetical protein
MRYRQNEKTTWLQDALKLVKAKDRVVQVLEHAEADATVEVMVRKRKTFNCRHRVEHQPITESGLAC